MKKYLLIITTALLSLMLLSCSSLTKATAFQGMYDENPVVMLIMPPINNSSNVEAKDYFYTTMNVPLAEAGYYVIPPATALATLQRESAYDSERFINGDLAAFRKMFGADVAVFTIIKSWNKQMLSSQIVIEIEYVFKSTKSNEVLYRRDATIICDTSVSRSSSGSLAGLLFQAAANAVKTAVTDYVSVAIMCNKTALVDLPYGKYHPKYGTDSEGYAYPLVIRMKASK